MKRGKTLRERIGEGVAVALASSACLGIMFISPSIPAAEAYNLIGCRWPSGGISYNNLMSGPAVTPSQNALSNWTSATVITFISSASNADFTMNNGSYGSTGWDGITEYRCSASGYFVKGTLVRLNATYSGNYGGPKKRSVIAHELGHVIGLDHRSTAACDHRSLMAPTTQGRFDDCGISTVQPDDANGAAALY